MTLLLLIIVSISMTFSSLGNRSEHSSFIRKIYNPTPKVSFKQTKLILTGDVMLGRNVMLEAIYAKNPNYPFKKVADKLRRADIVFINLENPIVKNCPRHDDGFTFCTTPEIAEGLVESGVDVVSLANNHSGNYGQKGITETVTYLENKGILVTGLGKLARLERNGIKFGFLGFEYVFKPANQDHLKLVAQSDPLVDILIVGVHWGDEYKAIANDFQRKLAREFIKNGADVVVGHHPHWVQDSEIIDGAPVYYSLGNFIFDQMWSEETRQGIVVELTFDDTNLVNQQIFKTYIKNTGQPEFLE